MIRTLSRVAAIAIAAAGTLAFARLADAGALHPAWIGHSPVEAGRFGDAAPEEIAARKTTVTIFNNGDIYAVDNQPLRPTAFAISKPVRIAKITTYHWNYGEGTGRPGTIGLLSDTGYWYGPWRAAGEPGQGGVPNAYWVVAPNLTLPAGTYRVVDSDPATWSQNGGSKGAGIAIVDIYTR